MAMLGSTIRESRFEWPHTLSKKAQRFGVSALLVCLDSSPAATLWLSDRKHLALPIKVAPHSWQEGCSSASQQCAAVISAESRVLWLCEMLLNIKLLVVLFTCLAKKEQVSGQLDRLRVFLRCVFPERTAASLALCSSVRDTTSAPQSSISYPLEWKCRGSCPHIQQSTSVS